MKPINLKAAMENRAVIQTNAKMLAYVNNPNTIKRMEAEIEACKAELATANDLAEKAIKEAEGKARERTICASDIYMALEEVEENLSIPKKYMSGISVEADLNAQSFANAYKYKPMSTHFTAEYKNGSWRLTDICRDVCRPNPRIRLSLTEDAKAALIKRFESM